MTRSVEPSVWGKEERHALEQLTHKHTLEKAGQRQAHTSTRGAIKRCLVWRTFPWCVAECVSLGTKLRQMDSVPLQAACMSQSPMPLL